MQPKQKAAINGLELKEALKRLSTYIEMDSQTTVSRIQSDLERDESEKLRNVTTFRTVLHSCVPKVCPSLPEMFYAVAGFNGYIAVVGPEQTEKVEATRASKDGTGTGGTKDW